MNTIKLFQIVVITILSTTTHVYSQQTQFKDMLAMFPEQQLPFKSSQIEDLSLTELPEEYHSLLQPGEAKATMAIAKFKIFNLWLLMYMNKYADKKYVEGATKRLIKSYYIETYKPSGEFVDQLRIRHYQGGVNEDGVEYHSNESSKILVGGRILLTKVLTKTEQLDQEVTTELIKDIAYRIIYNGKIEYQQSQQSERKFTIGQITKTISLDDFIGKWEMLSEHNEEKVIYRPCDAENKSFIISKDKGKHFFFWVFGQEALKYEIVGFGTSEDGETLSFELSSVYDDEGQSINMLILDDASSKVFIDGAEFVTGQLINDYREVFEPEGACR